MKDVELWQIEAGKNKLERINWKNILGTSLTRFVADRFGRGYNRERIIAEVTSICASKSVLTPKIEKSIIIGVGARLSEMVSEGTALKNSLIQNKK